MSEQRPEIEYALRARPPTNLKTVVAVALLVAVFCCCGLGVGGYALFRKIAAANSPIRDATAAYLDDLEGGDYAGAYGRLCRATQQVFTREAFTAAVSGNAAIRAHHIDEARLSNDQGRLGGTVTATLVTAAGAPRRHTFELTSEDGAWKVCGDPRPR